MTDETPFDNGRSGRPDRSDGFDGFDGLDGFDGFEHPGRLDRLGRFQRVDRDRDAFNDPLDGAWDGGWDGAFDDEEDGRRIGAELRRAAAEAVTGPARVEAVLRAGRARRLRRRVAGGAAALVAAAVAVPLVLGGLPASEPVPTPPARQPPASQGPQPGQAREVRPYEAVEVADGTVMALLPGHGQSYLVTDADTFRQDLDRLVAALRGGETAERLPADSISADTHPLPDRGVLIHGAWRAAALPAEIVVVPEGSDTEYPAQLLTLPGETGWGTYYLDSGELDRAGVTPAAELTVVARDADGEVVDSRPVPDWPRPAEVEPRTTPPDATPRDGS